MTKKDAGRLLVLIGDFVQNYQPTETSAENWAEALEGIEYDEARAAVIGHFKQSSFFPKPVDIIRIVRERKDRRVDNLVHVNFEDYFDALGAARTAEEKIAVISEIYQKRFANQLEGTKITLEDITAAMLAFVLEIPPNRGERSYRIGSLTWAIDTTRRYLDLEELIEKATERTAYHIQRLAAEYGR